MRISKQEFTLLIEKLTDVSTSCTDVLVRNGTIRQLSDTKDLIYLVNLPFEFDANLQIVKSYINIFKTFIPEEDDGYINFDIDNKNNILKIYDDYTTVSVMMGSERYMNAQFIDDTMLSKIIKETLYSSKIPINVLKRTKSLVKDFSTEIIEIDSKNNKITLKISSPSNTHKATLISFNAEEDVLPEGTYVTSANIFLKDYNDPTLEIVKSDSKGGYALKLSDNEDCVFSIITKRKN